MTSAENSVSEPPNLKIYLGKDTPRSPYKARVFGLAIMPSPVTKNLATALLQSVIHYLARNKETIYIKLNNV